MKIRSTLAFALITTREALLKGTLLFYTFIATAIILIVAAGFKVSPEDTNTILFFGKPVTLGHKGQTTIIINSILYFLHSGAQDSILLFSIFATAGLIPAFLEKGTVEIFLSKPISRFALFISRTIGANIGVAVNIIYFFIGIWLVIIWKFSIWNWGFLISALAVIIAFFCFFSLTALAGIITRSSGLAIMFSFIVLITSSPLENREKTLFLLWNNEIYHRILDTIYYILDRKSVV